jgi:hypothetical protein
VLDNERVAEVRQEGDGTVVLRHASEELAPRGEKERDVSRRPFLFALGMSSRRRRALLGFLGQHGVELGDLRLKGLDLGLQLRLVRGAVRALRQVILDGLARYDPAAE